VLSAKKVTICAQGDPTNGNTVQRRNFALASINSSVSTSVAAFVILVVFINGQVRLVRLPTVNFHLFLRQQKDKRQTVCTMSKWSTD
jgi:hypothetical protein